MELSLSPPKTMTAGGAGGKGVTRTVLTDTALWRNVRRTRIKPVGDMMYRANMPGCDSVGDTQSSKDQNGWNLIYCKGLICQAEIRCEGNRCKYSQKIVS